MLMLNLTTRLEKSSCWRTLALFKLWINFEPRTENEGRELLLKDQHYNNHKMASIKAETSRELQAETSNQDWLQMDAGLSNES